MNWGVKIVGWSVLLLPLWWFLGIEQFIWPILFGVGLLGVKRIRLVNPAKWFVVFLAIQLISSFSIEEASRWLTFTRTWLAYLGAFLGFVTVTSSIKRQEDVLFLLRCLIIMLGLAGVVGLLAIMGIWQPKIEAAVRFLLPSWIGETMYGSKIVMRSLGSPSWFFGLGQYFRVNSFFLYSTMYAPVIVLCLPIILWGLSNKKLVNRHILFIVLVISFVNLIFTTARMSTVGLLTGAAYYAAKFSKVRRMLLAIVWLSLMSIMLYFAIQTEWNVVSLEEQFNLAIYARGEGSVISRLGVYEATLRGVLKRPILGWGTERDVEGLQFPAGSHSYYLGVLYKHGIIGLLTFLALYWSLWTHTRPLKFHNKENWILSLLKYGRWSFIAIIINGMTDVLDLDATTLVIIWILFGILVSIRMFFDKSISEIISKNIRKY